MSTLRIIIVDSYYADVLRALDAAHPSWADLPYEERLQAVLDECFGTGDFYSVNLRMLGWNAVDVIANYPTLMGSGSVEDVAWRKINEFEPDVVFLQDFKVLGLQALDALHARGVLIAAQLSCPMPEAERVRRADVIFTSFPHYVERLRSMGVRRPVYSPLACEPTAITRTLAGREPPPRDIDVLFVGGVGKDVHWRAGTEALESLARAYGRRFQWWGYGDAWLEPESPLHDVYRGEAWGRAMYSLLLRAKVVVNRHGEVAENYANNMRIHETTSAGALLVTEAALNISEFFSTDEVIVYPPGGLVAAVQSALTMPPAEREAMAARAQRRALSERTYFRKMQQVDSVLREELNR
jgi:hypothetical protein